MALDLDAVPLKSVEQKEWWVTNRDDLSAEDREELFEDIVSSNKYLYNSVIVGITVEPDDAGRLVDNVERLHELLDADLSWSIALDWITALLDDKPPEVSDDVYRQLRDRGDTVYKDVGKFFLRAGNPDTIDAEILGLLDSDSEADIALGLKTAEQEYTDLADLVA